ncbi:MAG: glycosyltransferase family 39 protein [Saprospirales bacterium]|nr:glycosyltransferase family 39 protein [Saprospirales bacterium]MBK8491998.1 glycosyltransferase family 39 protein [Saprospirales bacterium]
MQSDWVSRQSFWLLLALVLAGINTLMLNELNTWLPGAEALMAGSWGSGLLSHPFLLRLPGPLLFFATLAATYWLGRRFFGKEAALLTLFVLAGSFLLVNSVKWATGDPWLLLFLVLTSLGMLGYLKQPAWSWRLLTWTSGAVSILIQPLWGLAALLGMALVWRFRHPDGKRLDGLYLWIWGPALVALSWWWKGDVWSTPFLYWTWTSGHQGWVIGAQILGMLPWLGLLVAGIVELIRNQSKGEELSILLGGLLLGAILSGSLLVQWAFALVIAKQLQRILKPGYPYENMLKTITILQLLGVLLLGIIGMIYGYLELGAMGFRMGMSLMLAYWMPGLFGAIGLFGRNQRLLVLGSAFGALLFSLAFWAQAGPWIESKRHSPQDLLGELDRENPAFQSVPAWKQIGKAEIWGVAKRLKIAGTSGSLPQ